MNLNVIKNSFKSIRVKAVILSVALIVTSSTLMVFYLIQTEAFFLKGELEKRAVTLAENFSRNCDYPLLVEDRAAITKLAGALMQDEDVVSVTVTNANGERLFHHAKEKTAGTDLPHLFTGVATGVVKHKTKDTIWLSLPIYYPLEQDFLSDQPLKSAKNDGQGRVIIGFSLVKAHIQINQMIVSTILLAAAITIIMTLMLLYIASRFLAPLLIIVRGIKKLSSGVLSHRVNIHRTDEIGELAVAFNEMAENLESSRNQLEASNQTLENRVLERTNALSNSEARYRAFFESTGTALVILEESGMVSFVNAEFERMFGYHRDEFENKALWTTAIAPEDREWAENIRNRSGLDSKSAKESYEFRVIDKSGQTRTVFATVSFIPGTNRKIASLIDISDKKRLETTLNQAQKMEAIGTLAGGMAHDFNNILMGIQGYASLALMSIKPYHPHFESLKKIEDLVQSGANLTRQLLGFARGGKYEIKPTNLNDIVEKTLSMFGRMKKELQISKRCAPDLWSVEVDRGQIEQVLLNLYVNAWQAMPSGGNLYLETANVYFDQKDMRAFEITPGPYAKITVTDTGVGMDEKTMSRIFEPFFTTKEMGRGTGLGLATVYGIVKGHNGIITVYSEKGQGTSFHVYLPASQKGVEQEKSLLETIERGEKTILVVDDEIAITDVSKALLNNLGYRTIIAKSGHEAVDFYKKQGAAIDLVILDLIMPGMNGGDTFDCLKDLNPDVKVILASGYGLDGMASQILERGCRGFIQKPFTVHSLSKKIREVLSV